MPKRSAPKKKSSSSSAKTAKKGAAAKPIFSSIAVVVSDRGQAVKWYTEKLGLDRVDDQDHWQTVGRKGQAGKVHLCQVSEFDEKAPLEPGNTGIALHLPGDFVAACQTLMDRGVDFSTPPTKFDWGWGAAVKDPDGNEIYLSPGA